MFQFQKRIDCPFNLRIGVRGLVIFGIGGINDFLHSIIIIFELLDKTLAHSYAFWQVMGETEIRIRKGF
jgi:hypothetical protein